MIPKRFVEPHHMEVEVEAPQRPVDPPEPIPHNLRGNRIHSIVLSAPEELRWLKYKHQYPDTKFNRLVNDLLKEYFAYYEID